MRGNACLGHGSAGGVDHVIHLRAEHQADGLEQQPPPFELRVRGQRIGHETPEQRHSSHLLQRDEARPHAVIHIVRVVGNFVGQVAQLGFKRRRVAQQKPLPHTAGLACFQSLGMRARAVLQNAFAGFKAQVQAVESRVALFQFIDHAQTLQVVLETTVLAHAGIQGILPRVAKRGVTQVVRQRNGFGQVFVQAQAARDAAAQLRHLQAVREAGAEQVTFVVQEHLGLVDQPPKRRAVHDAVAVALEIIARGGRRLGKPATPRAGGFTGQSGQRHVGHHVWRQVGNEWREAICTLKANGSWGAGHPQRYLMRVKLKPTSLQASGSNGFAPVVIRHHTRPP